MVFRTFSFSFYLESLGLFSYKILFDLNHSISKGIVTHTIIDRESIGISCENINDLIVETVKLLLNRNEMLCAIITWIKSMNQSDKRRIVRQIWIRKCIN